MLLQCTKQYASLWYTDAVCRAVWTITDSFSALILPLSLAGGFGGSCHGNCSLVKRCRYFVDVVEGEE